MGEDLGHVRAVSERDRAAPSFAPVLTRAADQPRLETPDARARPYKRLPEPKAHQGPISHLGSQIIELSSAIAGEAVPVLKTAGEAVSHLLGHVHRPGK